jgi:hypothetical protein
VSVRPHDTPGKGKGTMITRETVSRPTTTAFYFDPICPWTWITSRWLVEVAERREFTVDWRPLSLAQLNGGVENMPLQFQEAGRFSMRLLRMVAALRSGGLEDRVGRFYTEVGTRLHVDGMAPDADLLQRAAEASGVSDYLHAAEDERWDRVVADSTDEAMRLAGPDVGSPVLQIGGQDRGMYGPIVSPTPQGEAAMQLWDAVSTLASVPGFYEFKHGRSGAPQTRPVGAETAQMAT